MAGWMKLWWSGCWKWGATVSPRPSDTAPVAPPSAGPPARPDPPRMSLRLVRIDDRLIHGQVVAGWLRALGAKRIVIVDDATARDEFLREVLTLAAPHGVS